MSAEEFLATKARKTEAALRSYVDSWVDAPENLLEAVRYSLFAGGKRLRPALVLGAAEVVCGKDIVALSAACAIEMIHTYSLIHDDLPSMDDDDLRRGQPTSHKVYGEATAVLAGDALLTMAFDVAAEAGRTDVIEEIARAAGVAGMVGGQQRDMEAEGKSLSLEALKKIHWSKTGALIRVSLQVGALLADASSEQLEALTQYGEHLGLAFQIVDDILDVVGSPEKMGKPVGSDATNAKSTYPALLGIDEARSLAEKTVEEAVAALDIFGEEATHLREMARFTREREK